jgi:2,4-dienoyl-CoA reductase (NADPH2)
MQAARIAASRGHDVTLWDKGGYLGGSTPLAAMVKGFDVEQLPDYIEFMKNRVKAAGVEVKLGKEFSLEALEEFKADAVVIAVGGSPVLPDVAGIDGKNVIKTSDLYGTLRFFLRLFGPRLLRSLTKFWMPVGRNVVIIGAAIQGCQLGEFLVKRGRTVTIVDTGQTVGDGLAPDRKVRLLYWFDKEGVEVLSGVQLVKIDKQGLTVQTKAGQTRLLRADNVIPVLPFAPNTLLLDDIKGVVPETYAIGDCDSPATIPEAMSAGWTVGNTL